MTIQQWIADPQDFEKGVELYEQYGDNPAYVRTLKKRGESDLMRADLVYELGKLAPHVHVITYDHNQVVEDTTTIHTAEQPTEVAGEKKLWCWLKALVKPIRLRP